MIVNRDESKLVNVPEFIPVLMFIDLIVCIVFGIIFLVGLIRGNINFIYLVPIGVGLALGEFCDIYFNWYIGCSFDIQHNKIIFSYHLNGFGMSDKPTQVTIRHISKYKFNFNKQSITVFGDITKKAPLRKSTELRSTKLYFDFKSEDGQKIISKLDELKEVKTK